MTNGRCGECGVLWHEKHKMSCSQRYPHCKECGRGIDTEEIRYTYPCFCTPDLGWAKMKEGVE